jgi:hypothetical protein
MGTSKAISMTLRSAVWSTKVQPVIGSFLYVYNVVKKNDVICLPLRPLMYKSRAALEALPCFEVPRHQHPIEEPRGLLFSSKSPTSFLSPFMFFSISFLSVYK